MVSGTPLDLARLVKLSKPVVRARYAYADTEPPLLGDLLGELLAKLPTPGDPTRSGGER